MSSEKCDELLGRRISTVSSSSLLSSRLRKTASVYIHAALSPHLNPRHSHSHSRGKPSVSVSSTENNHNKPPVYFINSYSAYPRYRRDSLDFKISEKVSSPPDSDASMMPAPLQQSSSRRSVAGAGSKDRRFLKTYDVRSTSNISMKNIEICQNGRPILWVVTKTKLLGAPQVNICVGGPEAQGGAVVAACKLKTVRSGFHVLVGNPDSLPCERWPQVTYSSWNEKEYFFSYQGRRFSWRSPVTGLLSYLADSGDYHLVDIVNGTVLAAYIKDREWFAFKPIARIDFFVELGQGLELMALAAIMGVEERRRRKSSAAGTGGL